MLQVTPFEITEIFLFPWLESDWHIQVMKLLEKSLVYNEIDYVKLEKTEDSS